MHILAALLALSLPVSVQTVELRAKPFSELIDLYHAAETGDQREEVLWALAASGHPEATPFFRGLLFSGEPYWLLEPAARWFTSHGKADLPRIEDLAQAYLSYPPGQRRPFLVLIWTAAEAKDAALLWSLLPGSTTEEIEETVIWLSHASWRSEKRPLDERLRRELIRVWLRSKPKSIPEVFLRELLGKTLPSGSSSAMWRRLLKAQGPEADLLVEWFAVHPIRSFDAMRSLYQGARTEEEKDRAIWVAAVGKLEGESNFTYLGRLLGDGPDRLQRLARAFQSCPNAESRSRMAIQIANGVARAEDFPVVKEILRDSTVAEARTLARWFSRHPSAEVIPDFRQRLGVIHEDLWIPKALAAAGDPEVLEWAIGVLRRGSEDHRVLASSILSHSPLPAAAEQIRSVLAKETGSLYLLMLEFSDSNNRSPNRWWFYEEILKSGSPEDRLMAARYLRQLADSGEETAKRLLSEVP
ncbi:MAG TPA: hypothetical protein VFR31_17440 [Thermoanaerobaculia bacterium]|nr:hypothetical protein [Thermoanaerobaculia bacterium]